ncbi:MAG: hypothetical protein ACREJ3_01375, partial [Polyangiaceae bacterium]
LGAAPFLLLLLLEQRSATGAWLLPTQKLYFDRSDWPPNCHRLGLGAGVGCTVEHHAEVARFGAGGYSLREALRVTRERAGALGGDLFGFAPLALLAFVPAVVALSGVDATLAAFVLAFTVAYGLFYVGNAQFYGARHLFPMAPILWLLAARGAMALAQRARVTLDEARARATSTGVLLVVAFGCAYGPWRSQGSAASAYQAPRSDLRRSLAKAGIGSAILKSRDRTAVVAAFDPWADGDKRLFLIDDGSGIVDVRRAHPELPVILSLPMGELGKLYGRRPPPGLRVELDRAWPSFVRPSGLGTVPVFERRASGRAALLLSHAHPGAEVEIAFGVPVAGDYIIRVDGLVGPDQGNYALTLDSEALPAWRGYAPQSESRQGASIARTLSAERHVLVARCIGRDIESSGFDARLDALVGEPGSRLKSRGSP